MLERPRYGPLVAGSGNNAGRASVRRRRRIRTPAARTHFGYSEVRLDDKQGLVDDVFHKVAHRYDVMNDLMSGGLHRVWKDVFVAKVSHRSARPSSISMSRAEPATSPSASPAPAGRRRKSRCSTSIPTCCGVGRERAEKNGLVPAIEVRRGQCRGSALSRTAEFDAYTIAFGIRNVPRIDKALAEAYRVLKRGGRFLCLEFSQVEAPVLAKVYESYSFSVIPMIGRLVTGEAEPYRYLVESIRQFPAAGGFRGDDRKSRLSARWLHPPHRAASSPFIPAGNCKNRASSCSPPSVMSFASAAPASFWRVKAYFPASTPPALPVEARPALWLAGLRGAPGRRHGQTGPGDRPARSFLCQTRTDSRDAARRRRRRSGARTGSASGPDGAVSARNRRERHRKGVRTAHWRAVFRN